MPSRHLGVTAGRTCPENLVQLGQAVKHLSASRHLGYTHLHHGDCVGGDHSLAVIAQELGFVVIAHPPEDSRLRAWHASDEVRIPKPYHDRNADIVAETQRLVAMPSGPEQQRSGTWSTIRKARQAGRWIAIVTPDEEWIEEFDGRRSVRRAE